MRNAIVLQKQRHEIHFTGGNTLAVSQKLCEQAFLII
jgi:hypothetical protein